MRRVIIHYVNDPIGETSFKVQISGKRVKYGVLVLGFYERFLSMHPAWTVSMNSLRLVTVSQGVEKDLESFVSEIEQELLLISSNNTTRVPPISLKKAKAAVGGFRTLELVEPKSYNSLGRCWYLRQGILPQHAIESAHKETDEAKPETARLREMIFSYKLALALRQQNQSNEAIKAFAKAATIAAYACDPPPSDLWPRKIFCAWGAAVAHTSSDRWNEIALYKTAVQRHVWKLWYQRPDEYFDPRLTAQPVWNDDILFKAGISKLDWRRFCLSAHASKDLIHKCNIGADDTRISLPSKSHDSDFINSISDLAENLLLPKHDDKSSNTFTTRTTRVCAVYLDFLARSHRDIRCAPTNKYLRVELVLHGAHTSVLRVAHTIIHDFQHPRIYDPSFEHELWFDDSDKSARIALVLEILHPEILLNDSSS
eukprot:CAMPEP_0197319230 /NCGR_PEP_ID=MMETSP0891-20130614/53921_1 /TAXON_ID=44058 ORGANISM="Aureoumbra lagunensis, Strain CCMP1510" /NCGR_SAMPLE_ID=MMETSP0891 /ASSEMBLY_ACC=CAM_ASM_000534 /LENGTH=426 /DNA_ID=CAMNT_0042810053 /DNA_START=8 /DNA_END=1288 /DNA_ORIENTATION=+